MRSLLPWALVVGSLLSSSRASARPHTASVWTNAGLDLAFAQGGIVGINQELRVGASEGQIEELNTRIAAGWQLNRWLSLAGHYRFDLEGWHHHLFVDHRFGVDVQATGALDWLELSLRQRVQPELSSSVDDPARVVLRTRVRARFSVSEAVRPYLAFEPYLVAATEPWERLRFDAGVAFPKVGLDVSYRLDMPVAAPGAPRRHILTVGYTYLLEPSRQGSLSSASGPSTSGRR